MPDAPWAASPSLSEFSDLTIRFGEPFGTPVRKVVTRSRSRPTYKMPSWKKGSMVQCESALERDVCVLLDADPSISTFYPQPAEITYLLGGCLCRHYPDLLVEQPLTREFWEVKPRCNAEKEHVAARTQFMTQALPAHGFVYRLIDESFVSPTRLATAQEVLRHGRIEIPFLVCTQLFGLLAKRSPFRWADVLSNFLGDKTRSYVCRLMLEGRIDWEKNSSLHAETKLWLTSTHSTASNV
jgi:hypothetical protein